MAASGTASSPDGAVRVRVDACGMLTDVKLSPAALRQDAGRLAHAVLSVSQEAAAQARSAVHDVYVPLRNEGLVGELPVLLAETKPVAPPKPPAGTRRLDDEELDDEEMPDSVIHDNW
jgi:hypothetical protein